MKIDDASIYRNNHVLTYFYVIFINFLEYKTENTGIAIKMFPSDILSVHMKIQCLLNHYQAMNTLEPES